MNPEDKLKPMGTQSKDTMDKAADTAKHAIHSTQQAADDVMGKVSAKVDQARSQLKPAMDNMSDALASAMDVAIDYAKTDPLKAMLIAAATGAFLIGLLSMLVPSRD
ncbi:MAG: hypothetical protein M3Y41_20330 [Pseudomonadota bacterium]|nr:hypothetical protein [Pseudomonadota bacterium]